MLSTRMTKKVTYRCKTYLKTSLNKQDQRTSLCYSFDIVIKYYSNNSSKKQGLETEPPF